MPQQTYIYYIIDTKNHQFYFFKDRKSTEAKAVEVGIDPRLVDFKGLKNYYGTVWLAVKWNGDQCAYVVQGRYKDLQEHKKYGYTLKKFVLVPYNEWNKQFEEPHEELNEETKQAIDKADLTTMFNNTKRRSPF